MNVPRTMLLKLLTCSLLLTAVTSVDICDDIDSLQDRRDTENVRSIVSTATTIVVVLPFLPLAIGANALGRKSTSDRTFKRIFDKFNRDRLQLQDYIENTCGLRVVSTYLEKGKSYVTTLSVIGIVCGSIELGIIVGYMLLTCM